MPRLTVRPYECHNWIFLCDRMNGGIQPTASTISAVNSHQDSYTYWLWFVMLVLNPGCSALSQTPSPFSIYRAVLRGTVPISINSDSVEKVTRYNPYCQASPYGKYCDFFSGPDIFVKQFLFHTISPQINFAQNSLWYVLSVVSEIHLYVLRLAFVSKSLTHFVYNSILLE